MRQTIRSLAAAIQVEWPYLYVHIERGHCNTDRHIPGTRLRHPGKGRWGTRIIVRDLRSKPSPGTDAWRESLLLDHNNAETYRHTGEVVNWMNDYREQMKGKRVP